MKCFLFFAAGLSLKPAVIYSAQKSAAPENQGRHFPHTQQPSEPLVIRCFTHGCPEKKRQSRDFHAIPRGTHNGEGKRKRKKKKTSNRCSQPQNKWHFLTPLIPLMANKLEPQIIIPSPSAAPFICQAQSSPSINSSRLVTPCKGWKYPSAQPEKQTSSWS